MRLLVCLAAVLAMTACAAGTQTVTVIHTNDFHARFLPDGARLAAAVLREKAARPDAIVLDAGDRFTGSDFYTFHKSRDVADFFNRLPYAAMTLGNHDFDDGTDELNRFLEAVKAPVAVANVVLPEPAQSEIVPYVRLSDRVAVIGVLTEDVTKTSAGAGSVRVLPVADTVQKTVRMLEKQGVDIIIVLSHIGFDEDVRLAQSVSGIDIIVGGHSHTVLKNYPFAAAAPDGKTVLIATAGEYGQYVGTLSADFNDGGDIVRYRGQALKTALFEADEKTQKMIDGWYSEIKKRSSETLFETKTPLGFGGRDQCLAECPLGEFLTDALKAAAPQAEIALMNSGAIRRELSAGKVALGDVLAVMPFDNSAVLARLTGKELNDWLERGVKSKNAFLQIAGTEYCIDGQGRVHSPLIPDKTYTVVLSAFLANGGDGYPKLRSFPAGGTMRDLLLKSMRKNGKVDFSLKKRVQERSVCAYDKQ